MAEKRNVEGVIVGVDVEGEDRQSTALIETDDGIRVEASFNHNDLVAPEVLHEGTRIRLGAPMQYMFGDTVQGPDGEMIDVDPQDRQPFVQPDSAHWIDGNGQAHALAVDSRQPAMDTLRGSDRDQGQVAADENNQQEKVRTMTSVGKKTVQGNLTADPRTVHTKAGQDMVVFKMAENHRQFNESSRQWQDSDPTFYDVAVDRDRLGANVLSSLHKGDRVTVSGNYQVGAYSTSTGQPGLNHRIWAEDVAASMQYNPVTVLPRDHHRIGASLTQSPSQSVDQGLQPEKMTPEAYTSWAAQNPVAVPGAQQGAAGPTR
ncbi:single-stranded DNA-binding protein [Microbacterium sp. A93]|uniref:single-stranded DNA-binding protein n=1 Tax=Microbacterium sp. A93 TaxID=3450716 RepID=UPI003F4441BB